LNEIGWNLSCSNWAPELISMPWACQWCWERRCQSSRADSLADWDIREVAKDRAAARRDESEGSWRTSRSFATYTIDAVFGWVDGTLDLSPRLNNFNICNHFIYINNRFNWQSFEWVDVLLGWIEIEHTNET